MRRRTALLLAILALFAARVCTAQGVDGRTSVVHRLGVADPRAAYELVLGVISPGGRAVLDDNTLAGTESHGLGGMAKEIGIRFAPGNCGSAECGSVEEPA